MKLTNKTRLALASAFIISASALAASAAYSFFGDANLASPGYQSPTAAQFRSATSGVGYGGVNFSISAGMTVADLTNLKTWYEFLAGSCGGGAPRFEIAVTTPSGPKNIFVYLGPAPNYTGCPQNIWADSGNLVTPTNLVDASQLGGQFYEPWFMVQQNYGTYPIVGIDVVTDSDWLAGNDPQIVMVDNVMINDQTFTFEGPDSCKGNGWQSFTTAPGPFKNQGQCVSYFEHQK